MNNVEMESGVNPSIILAVRMFCSSIYRYRQHKEKYENDHKSNFNTAFTENELQKQNGSEKGFPFFSMCGDASDISKLELGIIEDINNDKLGHETYSRQSSYTLRHVYVSLSNTLAMTSTEQQYFTLPYFHKLVSTITRNAIGVTTQSPFKPYYSALLRYCGRGTQQHKDCMKKVALCLGSEDGKLGRLMDREVEERVSTNLFRRGTFLFSMKLLFILQYLCFLCFLSLHSISKSNLCRTLLPQFESAQ